MTRDTHTLLMGLDAGGVEGLLVIVTVFCLIPSI